MLLNRKFVLLIASICLFLSITTLQDTYAKYASSINETTDISIARWRILVNDYDIRSSSTTSNLIHPTFSGNTNIAGGVIAPTAAGYYDIEIDATDADLSFSYTITMQNDNNSAVSDVKITSCTKGGSPLSVVNGTITGNIRLSDPRVNTITCYIEWDDGVNSTMDNAADTQAASGKNPVATIDISANFIQLAS